MLIENNFVTAVIRFCLDFKATLNEKSHNCCLLIISQLIMEVEGRRSAGGKLYFPWRWL